MVRYAAALIAFAGLAGCACEPELVREPFPVNVPIAVAPDAPESLFAPLLLTVPSWISPDAVSASSALDQEGERKLKAMVAIYESRIDAWEAWFLGLQAEPAMPPRNLPINIEHTDSR